jgi:hypothetical protein
LSVRAPLQAFQKLGIDDVRKFARVRRPFGIKDAIDVQKNDLHALPPSQPALRAGEVFCRNVGRDDPSRPFRHLQGTRAAQLSYCKTGAFCAVGNLDRGSLDLTPYKDEKDFGLLRRLVRKAG